MQGPDLFRPTVASHRPGARTLTRDHYTDPAVFEMEQKRIFGRAWVCVGRSDRLRAPGDRFVVDVAGEQLVVVRESPGVLRAFFNVCRHRGTRVCSRDDPGTGPTIRCPYHGWSYALNGRLVAAPHMDHVPGFDKEENALYGAHVAEWEGFLFVSVADDPVPFAQAYAPMQGRLSRFGLGHLRARHEEVYDVRANWKLVFQNFNECLHCPVIHPELSRVMPYDSGANDLTRGPFLGGYMALREPHESGTLSGRACARSVSDDLQPEDRRRAYFYSLMPNLCLSIHPDYAVSFVLQPVAADRTRLTVQWLFHPENAADKAGFAPMEAVRFWDVTNRQDWHVVERSHEGVSSSRYTPGLYSARESLLAAWDEEYRAWMGVGGGIRGGAPAQSDNNHDNTPQGFSSGGL